jgi:beta-lactamase regulating signal transducer with metallopeptidase domain
VSAVLMPLLVILTARVSAGAGPGTTLASPLSGVVTAATLLGVHGGVAGLAYLGVAVLLLLRVGVGVWALARVWHSAAPVAALSSVDVRVRCSAQVSSPIATGSGILLPVDWSAWSDDARICVLSHERSRVVRKDFYWQLLARVYAAVFWFNPFTWLVLRKIVVLAEQVSDDAAVATIGRPADYAAVLL